MDILKVLQELITSKDPYSVLDTYFKCDAPMVYRDINIILPELYDTMYGIFIQTAIESWMDDDTKKEMEVFVAKQLTNQVATLKATIIDGMDRNYDMDKYLEFLIEVTKMSSKT